MSSSTTPRPGYRADGKTRLPSTKFIAKLMPHYDHRCAITGVARIGFKKHWTVHACHILAASDGGTMDVTNGIPMRADLHALWDAGLIGIHPRTLAVHILGDVGEHYRAELEGLRVLLPKDRAAHPDREALKVRWAAR